MTNHGVNLATLGNTTKGARHMQGYIVATKIPSGTDNNPFFVWSVFKRYLNIFKIRSIAQLLSF